VRKSWNFRFDWFIKSRTPKVLVRIHFIIVMIRWTGLAPWEFEFPFPGSLTSTFLNRSWKRGSSSWHKKQRPPKTLQ